MTQAKHTAGLWRVFDAFSEPEIITDRRTAYETESVIRFKGQSNAKANARLMAAAPDLLDILKSQTDAAQAVIDSWEKGDLAGSVTALTDSVAPARDAIAKATGSES
jgi:hypothetical protein